MVELTSHQIGKMTKGLSENNVSMLRYTFLEFFLQEPTAMLVFAHTRDFPNQVLQPAAGESVV
jgi:hypothetical protein